MNKKSFKLIGLVALVASTVLLVACQSETKTKNSKSKDVQWGYTGSTGPDHWGDLSKDYELSKNGKEQSPINITGAEDVDLPELILNNQESEAQVENNGHTIEVSFKNPKNTLTIVTKFTSCNSSIFTHQLRMKLMVRLILQRGTSSIRQIMEKSQLSPFSIIMAMKIKP